MSRRVRPAPSAAAAARAEAAELVFALCLEQPSCFQLDWRTAVALQGVAKRLRALAADACRGALVVRARVRAQRARALATWLSRHGALLAELALDLRGDALAWRAAAVKARCDSLAARTLDHVPPNLQRLSLSGWIDDASAAQQAAALATALSRQPMQLRSLALPAERWAKHTATVLPALGQLRQLSSLAIGLPADPSDLQMRHLPEQLQQLEVCNSSRHHASTSLPWLALEHVSGLTSLRMPGVRLDGGALPCGLRALEVANVKDVAPLRQLAQLTALQLAASHMSAEQLRDLSTLVSLEQLSVTAPKKGRRGLNDAAAVLAALPLTHLSAPAPQLSTACMVQLAACARMTHLQLCALSLADGATMDQLALALARLTALQHLELQAGPALAARAPQPGGGAAWAPTSLCQTLARLPQLRACALDGVRLGRDAASALAGATQLSELALRSCGLHDDLVQRITGGLRALRALDVGCNVLSDGCLDGMATLWRLTLLRARNTGVTRPAVRQLRQALPQLSVEWGRHG